MAECLRIFFIALIGLLALCGCEETRAEQESGALITKPQLDQRCDEIKAKWGEEKSIPEMLAWLEETMKGYGAEYAFQRPTVVGRVVFHFNTDAASSLGWADFDKIESRIRDLNPQFSKDMRTTINKPEHLEEAASLYKKYDLRGGAPRQVNDHEAVANLGLKREYFEQFWDNPELNSPPGYIADLLNEYEQKHADGKSWVFTRSEWREWFTYIYSGFLKKEEGWENALYLNYAMGFSASRNREGKLENVRLEKIECFYPAGPKGLETLMPPAISPKHPIEPFYGQSCNKYERWLGCHKIRNEFEERKFKTNVVKGCEDISPVEPVCTKSDI